MDTDQLYRELTEDYAAYVRNIAIAAERESGQELIITDEGEEWRIVNYGAAEDDSIFCHLASTTRGRHQKNGWYPVQSGRWIEAATIHAAITSR